MGLFVVLVNNSNRPNVNLFKLMQKINLMRTYGKTQRETKKTYLHSKGKQLRKKFGQVRKQRSETNV